MMKRWRPPSTTLLLTLLLSALSLRATAQITVEGGEALAQVARKVFLGQLSRDAMLTEARSLGTTERQGETLWQVFGGLRERGVRIGTEEAWRHYTTFVLRSDLEDQRMIQAIQASADRSRKPVTAADALYWGASPEPRQGRAFVPRGQKLVDRFTAQHWRPEFLSVGTGQGAAGETVLNVHLLGGAAKEARPATYEGVEVRYYSGRQAERSPSLAVASSAVVETESSRIPSLGSLAEDAFKKRFTEAHESVVEILKNVRGHGFEPSVHEAKAVLLTGLGTAANFSAVYLVAVPMETKGPNAQRRALLALVEVGNAPERATVQRVLSAKDYRSLLASVGKGMADEAEPAARTNEVREEARAVAILAQAIDRGDQPCLKKEIARMGGFARLEAEAQAIPVFGSCAHTDCDMLYLVTMPYRSERDPKLVRTLVGFVSTSNHRQEGLFEGVVPSHFALK